MMFAEKSRFGKGMFVTVDGPNGVGKTSVVNGVVSRLNQMGIEAVRTREPTNSHLGHLIRQFESIYRGRVYACLVAADRYLHLETEVMPAIQSGKIIVSARYVESSLVLQRLDGVDVDFIWAINSQIYRPDLSVILTAPAEVLEDRLKARLSFSRFEKSKTRQDEMNYYLQAAEFLLQQGFNILLLDNGNVPIEQTVNRVVEEVILLLTKG